MRHPGNLPTLNDFRNNPQTKRTLFRSLPLFVDVEDEHCYSIADSSHYIYRTQNQQIITQDDQARRAYIILSGLIKISRIAEIKGRSIPRGDVSLSYHLSYRGPGQPLGINNLVCDETHLYTMQTVKASHLVEINKETFMKAFNASNFLRRNVIRYINRRFYETADQLQQSLRLTVKEARFVGELLHIIDAFELQLVSDDDDIQERLVIDWLETEKLAQRLGCAPRVISQAKQRLRDARIITVLPNSGTITINNPDIAILRSIYGKLDALNLEQAINAIQKK